MAKQKIKNPSTIICLFMAIFSFTGIIVFFTIGGIFFSDQHPKVLNYANSMCQVDSKSYKVYVCRSRYYTYTCYGPTWNVHHGEHLDVFAIVETQMRYQHYSDAISKANEYQIGSSYSCWYDRRNPSVAQWEKPSTVVATILLSCGGLSALLTILFIFLTVKLVKQEILQNRHDNMGVDLYPNSYMNK